MTRRIARAVAAFVRQRTGRVPGHVDVEQGDGTLVITLHNMPASAQARHRQDDSISLEPYRELFAESSGWLRREIRGITELHVLAVTAIADAASRSLVLTCETAREWDPDLRAVASPASQSGCGAPRGRHDRSDATPGREGAV